MILNSFYLWIRKWVVGYLLLCQVCSALYLQIGDKCPASDDESPFNLRNDSSVIHLYVEGSDSLGGKENVSISDISGNYSVQVCDPNIPLECLAGRCQCKKGYTISRNGTKCLEVARHGLDSTCEENIQCWKSLLGRMSECNLAMGKCQCYESETLPIVFHQGRCYYGESLGEFCQIEGLCEATTPNATCRSGGTCQCKEGFVPSWDKSRCLPIAMDGLDSFCEENIQCEQSQMGALSECNQLTMKCNCYKIPDMDTVFHGGKCYIEAALGDVCQVSAQCLKKTLYSLCSKNGKCRCDDGYIPNGNNTLCLPIPVSDSTGNSPAPEIPVNPNNNNNNNSHHAECQEDSQCLRRMGPYSRCNSKGKCECFVGDTFPFRYMHEAVATTTTASILSKHLTITEPEQLEILDHVNPTLVMVGSKCYLGKYLGQRCKFNKQCLTLTEYSMCDGRCVCHETHVRSEDGRKCLPIAQGLHSECDEDPQCRKSSLGALSHCSGERKRCECANSVMPVVYFKEKCHFHRQLGSACEQNVECQAGLNYLAECSMGRCRCQNGTIRVGLNACGFNATGNSAANWKSPLYSVLNIAYVTLFRFLIPNKI